MVCEDYQEQASRLVDNELGEHESPTLFAHLSTCRECRRFLHATLQLRSGLQEQAPVVTPAHLDGKVLGSLPAKRQYAPDRVAVQRSLWKRRVSLPAPVAAAMIMLLMLGSAVLTALWFRDSEPGYQTRTIYVTALPAVEVQGFYSQPESTIQ